MPAVGQHAGVEAILGAAKRNGMSERETAALLAASYKESTWNPQAVGDNGTSFGLFQHHVGGAGGPTVASARRFLSPVESASEAAARFKTAGVTSGKGAAASQRPANPREYASDVDGIMRKILAGTFTPLNRLIGDGDTSLTGRSTSKPKWSPLRDQTAAKARELGLRHTSGDRSPASNSAAGGVGNSNHLSTKTEAWADDYVGDAQAMAALVAWAKSNGAIEAMVHDAGSGLHAHIAGSASAGASSSSSSGGSSSSSSGASGLQTVWFGGDVAGAGIKVGVLVVGLALAAGLIYAGVTRLTNTQGIASGLAMTAATKGAAK